MDKLSKLGFLLFILGGAGMDSPDRTVAVIMVLAGLSLIALSALAERRKQYEISHRVCRRKMSELRKQQKRLIGVAIYIEG